MNSTLVQFLCCFLLAMPTFITAFAIVWPSYTLTVLKGPNSPLGYSITSHDANMIGSFPFLGSITGAIIGGFLSESLGRRRTEILCGLVLVLSWSLTTTARSVALLTIARLIVGLGGGIHLVTVLVYVNEICQPSFYGFAVNFTCFMYSLGTLISYLAGWFCSYYVICYMNLSLSVIFVALVCLLKDSPGYLIGKGQDKEALKSLKFFRGMSTITQDLLDELAYFKNQREARNADKSGISKVSADECEKLKPENEEHENVQENPWKILRTSKSSQRAIITIASVSVLTQLTGVAGVQAYAGQLFKLAAPELSSDLCSVILAVTIIMACGLAAAVIDMFKRRTLLLFSTIVNALSLFLLGTMLKWQWAPQWAIPCVVLLYCAVFHLGPNNVPFVLLGESLMPQVKSLGTSIFTCSMNLASFVTLTVFIPSVENLGLDITFFIFSVLSVLSTIFTYSVVKETRGVKFETVQEMYELGYLCR